MHNQYTTGAAAGQAPGFELDSSGRWTRKKTFDELPLCDRSSSGKVRPWRTRKLQALSLADIYEGLALQACPEDRPAAAAASSMAAAIDAELGLSTTPDGIQYNAATGEIIEHSVEHKLPTAAAKYLDKAERLARCAAWAEFERLPEGQGLRLHDASFCRVRLCPMCQWRRSLKLGAQVRRVVERANADHLAETGAPWRWLMVTFTVQNVPGPQLGAEIDRLHKAVNNLAKCARWRAAVRGWLRATEVTHNTDKKSRSYDTYHPHLHMLLCVPAGYFSGKGYIRQKEWADLWAHYARTDYTPIVDIRTIKAEDGRSVQDLPAAEQAAAMGKACAEVSKYAAKPGDYIIAADPQLSMRTVALLDSMLDKRRMTSWGGVLKDIAKALQLDDPADGDLIHIDEAPSTDPTAEALAQYVAYCWALGARDYLPQYQRTGPTEQAERLAAAADRRRLRAGRAAAAAAEHQAAMDTVDVYMQAAGWDAREQAKAAHELRTLPRAVIEQRIAEYQQAIELPEGWEDSHHDQKTAARTAAQSCRSCKGQTAGLRLGAADKPAAHPLRGMPSKPGR